MQLLAGKCRRGGKTVHRQDYTHKVVSSQDTDLQAVNPASLGAKIKQRSFDYRPEMSSIHPCYHFLPSPHRAGFYPVICPPGWLYFQVETEKAGGCWAHGFPGLLAVGGTGSGLRLGLKGRCSGYDPQKLSLSSNHIPPAPPTLTEPFVWFFPVDNFHLHLSEEYARSEEKQGKKTQTFRLGRSY